MYQVVVLDPQGLPIKVFYSEEALSPDQERAFIAQWPEGFWLDISRVPLDEEPDEWTMEDYLASF